MELESRMVKGNLTQEHAEEEEEGYAMEVLFTRHNVAMAVACVTSLTLGLPLVINMLTQLKVRSCLHFAWGTFTYDVRTEGEGGWPKRRCIKGSCVDLVPGL